MKRELVFVTAPRRTHPFVLPAPFRIMWAEGSDPLMVLKTMIWLGRKYQ